MKKKKFDCIKLQRKIRTKLPEEANYDLHSLVQQVRENNKTSKFYKILLDKKEVKVSIAT